MSIRVFSSSRRRVLALSSATALGAGLHPVTPAWAQEPFPTRPVKIIVPFPPGQAADIFARLLAERLNAVWKQNVIVENRAGGGGVPGIMAGKAAAPDGYTLTMGTSGTLGVNPGIYAALPYDPLKDFAPVSNVFIAPLMVLAHPDAPYKTLAELIALAKREPGKHNFASAGTGTAQHMSAELFKARAGIDLVHVPYKGSGPAMADLLAGQVTLMFDSVTSALPQVRASKLRALAVTTAERVPQLPQTPTIAESGVTGFAAVGWSGIVAPISTPRALVNKLSIDIQAILREPEFANKILERGSIPDPNSPEVYGKFIADEITKWKEVARVASVKLD
jgi:tripartite-type tricarboxylate transporter receptor subunit TctC